MRVVEAAAFEAKAGTWALLGQTMSESVVEDDDDDEDNEDVDAAEERLRPMDACLLAEGGRLDAGVDASDEDAEVDADTDAEAEEETGAEGSNIPAAESTPLLLLLPTAPISVAVPVPFKPSAVLAALARYPSSLLLPSRENAPIAKSKPSRSTPSYPNMAPGPTRVGTR